ncbi:MAG: transglutaminase domain-containing protein [Oscillospiraceae bacterium]|nr:transglutaminase domain-containing protein [Oscillospiraceae bacterium]
MVYIHPNDKIIEDFLRETVKDRSSLQRICEQLFCWFEENVAYSRLSAPFFPLQRSDLDVLSMLSGTCGDYANLLVSVFLKLGYEAKYAYVHRDCYGDEQDHICGAVKVGEEWLAVDATQPYRKWHGFPCPHREFDLLSPEEFEEKMKREEAYWTGVALDWGKEHLAGLLYAPWIHEEILERSESLLESVFFLLSVNRQMEACVYAYYMKYTKEHGALPVMCKISDGVQVYCFSCKVPDSLWDNAQWSEEYPEGEIPESYCTEKFRRLKTCITKVLPDINRVISLISNRP